jgi:hypothetical protein
LRFEEVAVGEALNEQILGTGVETLEPVDLQETEEDPTGDPTDPVDPVDHDGEDDELTIREDGVLPGMVAVTVIHFEEGEE